MHTIHVVTHHYLYVVFTGHKFLFVFTQCNFWVIIPQHNILVVFTKCWPWGEVPWPGWRPWPSLSRSSGPSAPSWSWSAWTWGCGRPARTPPLEPWRPAQEHVYIFLTHVDLDTIDKWLVILTCQWHVRDLVGEVPVSHQLAAGRVQQVLDVTSHLREYLRKTRLWDVCEQPQK